MRTSGPFNQTVSSLREGTLLPNPCIPTSLSQVLNTSSQSLLKAMDFLLERTKQITLNLPKLFTKFLQKIKYNYTVSQKSSSRWLPQLWKPFFQLRFLSFLSSIRKTIQDVLYWVTCSGITGDWSRFDFVLWLVAFSIFSNLRHDKEFKIFIFRGKNFFFSQYLDKGRLS